VSPAKTAETFAMPFELRTRVGRGNHALGGVQISHGKGNSGGGEEPPIEKYRDILR